MNSLPAHLINLITLQLARISFSPYKTILKKQAPPLLVSGIFRSGTSITTNILSKAGFDAGPLNHQLQATSINPDGYFENYFFMDLSRYLFRLTNSYGDNPPAENVIDKIGPEILSDDDFRKFTLLDIHDDRVSNRNKLNVLKKVSIHHMKEYLSHAFGEKPLIKNPHFSVLEPFFKKVFPDSKRVVVFRNPEDWKKSAQVVSEKSDFDLYNKYYSYYLKSNQAGIIYFNYDNLLVNPEGSIQSLLNALGVEQVSGLVKLIRKNENATGTQGHSFISSTHEELLKRAINK